MPIDESIRLANELFEDVMESNDVVKGLATIEPYREQSVYHSFIRCLYLIMTAMTSVEKVDIEAAQKSVNDSIKICNKYRKTGLVLSVMKMIKTPNYEKYTDCKLLMCKNAI